MNEADNGANHENEGNQPDPAEADAKIEAGDETETEDLEGVAVRDSDESLVDPEEEVAQDLDQSEEIAALKDQLFKKRCRIRECEKTLCERCGKCTQVWRGEAYQRSFAGLRQFGQGCRVSVGN